MYRLPICANCTRYAGRTSVFAPVSIRSTSPPSEGRTAPMAGRSIPAIRPRCSRAATIVAPLLPAETAALAVPSFTARRATLIEAAGLRRTACAGCSSIVTSSAASITGRERPVRSCFFSSARIFSGLTHESNGHAEIARCLHRSRHIRRFAVIAARAIEGNCHSRHVFLRTTESRGENANGQDAKNTKGKTGNHLISGRVSYLNDIPLFSFSASLRLRGSIFPRFRPR